LIGDPSGGIGAADTRSDVLIDLALAQGKEPLAGLLATMRVTLLLSFILLMALLAGLARISISIGLKPLRQMAREVGSIGASNLDLRLTPNSQSQELNPITDRLNDLLERLEDAFDREKRFSGNVAHELRTPIAELRTLAEVGKEWPSERDMVEGFFSDLIELADDMERTVVNLLMLARLDAGTQEVIHESFNLCDLVDDICKKFRQNSSERRISLDNRITGVLYATTDKDKLKLILTNIIFNAVSYSPSDSSVVIEALREGEDVELIVSNETVDLCEKDVQMMFERFWRKDQVRSEDNHAGLGLSLVKALADLLKIRISPTLDADSRLTLSLSGLAITL
jgi:two-component system sensor histidine kinase QseC